MGGFLEREIDIILIEIYIYIHIHYLFLFLLNSEMGLETGCFRIM